jgi:hypothetical protein
MIELIKDHWFYFSLPFLFVANAYWIIGLHNLFHVELYDDDEPDSGIIPKSKGLLWFVSVWSFKLVGMHWSKPLVRCPYCMASVHSVYPFWIAALLYGFEWVMIPLYVSYAVCLSGYVFIKSNYE